MDITTYQHELKKARRIVPTCLTAVRLGATKNGLPFEIQIPNEKTMRAIEHSRQGKGKIFFPVERHMAGVLE